MLVKVISPFKDSKGTTLRVLDPTVFLSHALAMIAAVDPIARLPEFAVTASGRTGFLTALTAAPAINAQQRLEATIRHLTSTLSVYERSLDRKTTAEYDALLRQRVNMPSGVLPQADEARFQMLDAELKHSYAIIGPSLSDEVYRAIVTPPGNSFFRLSDTISSNATAGNSSRGSHPLYGLFAANDLVIDRSFAVLQPKIIGDWDPFEKAYSLSTKHGGGIEKDAPLDTTEENPLMKAGDRQLTQILHLLDFPEIQRYCHRRQGELAKVRGDIAATTVLKEYTALSQYYQLQPVLFMAQVYMNMYNLPDVQAFVKNGHDKVIKEVSLFTDIAEYFLHPILAKVASIYAPFDGEGTWGKGLICHVPNMMHKHFSDHIAPVPGTPHDESGLTRKSYSLETKSGPLLSRIFRTNGVFQLLLNGLRNFMDSPIISAAKPLVASFNWTRLSGSMTPAEGLNLCGAFPTPVHTDGQKVSTGFDPIILPMVNVVRADDGQAPPTEVGDQYVTLTKIEPPMLNAEWKDVQTGKSIYPSEKPFARVGVIHLPRPRLRSATADSARGPLSYLPDVMLQSSHHVGFHELGLNLSPAQVLAQLVSLFPHNTDEVNHLEVARVEILRPPYYADLVENYARFYNYGVKARQLGYDFFIHLEGLGNLTADEAVSPPQTSVRTSLGTPDLPDSFVSRIVALLRDTTRWYVTRDDIA